ncbi:MAG TPA: TlpA disulfide reductase family protein [Pseudonocardiaceae bacterium]|nr:TlpA disulfide reductase family protein [Pseudonocardiaceae bacterium]
MTGRVSAPLRWLLAGVVVVAAVVIAVWPRGHGAVPVAAAPAPPNLTADRAKAALAPCRPRSTATPTLADVRVTCLASGSGVDLGSLLGGQPALVNVWASWCVPCQQELPALDAYAVRPGAVPVIGVQVQSDQRSGLELLAGLGVHHLQMVYDTGAAAKALKLPVGLPVSYLVEPDGTATVITRPSRVLDSATQVAQAVATYTGGAG